MIVHRLGCAAIALSATLAAAQGRAATDATQNGELTLEEALARSEQVSPLIRRARLELGIASASRVGASVRLPANPVVSGSVDHRWDSSGSVPPAQGVEGFVRIEQMLEVAGQRGTRIREAQGGIRVAEARARLALIETRARVQVSYLAVLIAEAQLDNARRREALGQRLYESARGRVQAGAASDVELRLAEVERGRLAAERISAESSVIGSVAELRQLLALPVNAPLRLTGRLSHPPRPAKSIEQLLAQARGLRADLRALAERHAQLDAAVVRLRREIVPNPTLWAEYGSQQPGQHYFGGGVNLPIPLWRRNQGELAILRAEQEFVDGERQILDREIGVEVARTLQILENRRAEEELYDRDVVPAAEATVGLVERGWRAGKFDLFRVIAASREAGESRRRQLEQLGALWQAAIELERATGGPQ